jgi:hypothetical protein
MPNKRVGNKIYHKVGGNWKLKQKCKSVASAKRAMKLLRGVSHGWRPTGRKRHK